MRAVTLMDIVIEDENALNSVLLLQVAGSNSYIVKHAKAIDGILSARMMARRADDGESIAPFTLHDAIDSLEDSTNCESCYLF